MDQTEALVQAADAFAKIIEVCAGHRARAEAAGFSPTVAEHMAVTLHDALIGLTKPVK